MAARLVPCEKCGTLKRFQYRTAHQVCQTCFKAEKAKAAAARLTCPKCGKPKHRQSATCQSCRQKPQNYLTRKCRVCKKKFTIHKSQAAQPQLGRFCSRACSCAGVHRRKKETLAFRCDNCLRAIDRHASDVKKNKSGHWFCNHACWYAFNQGSNHYLWKGGQHERMCPEARVWRKAVLARDRKCCRFCGGRKQLEVHHIRPFRNHPEIRWAVSNGITLCETCHDFLRLKEMDHFRTLELMAGITPQWK